MIEEKELLEQIGARLKKLRVDRGLGIVDVEAGSGISKSQVHDIEAANKAPSIHSLNALLGFYQISWEKFFTKL